MSKESQAVRSWVMYVAKSTQGAINPVDPDVLISMGRFR